MAIARDIQKDAIITHMSGSINHLWVLCVTLNQSARKYPLCSWTQLTQPEGGTWPCINILFPHFTVLTSWYGYLPSLYHLTPLLWISPHLLSYNPPYPPPPFPLLCICTMLHILWSVIINLYPLKTLSVFGQQQCVHVYGMTPYEPHKVAIYTELCWRSLS